MPTEPNPADFWPDRFANQIGVLTGGDIARAAARQLVQEGARVFFCDINLEQAEAIAAELNSLVPESATACQVDVTNEEQVRGMFDQVVADAGKVDFVLHSAGITDTTDMRAPIWELDMGAFRKRQEVNLVGSAIVTKHAARVMIPNQYGRICIMASNSAKEGNPTMSAYSASKGGVVSFIKTVGRELHPHGVLITGFAPVIIHTALVDGMHEEDIQHLVGRIPMGRMGRLDEAAYKLCHLLSRRNSFQTRWIEDMSGGRADY
jgi:3-oxoacyl-[acyl-carrier protein] reductase